MTAIINFAVITGRLNKELILDTAKLLEDLELEKEKLAKKKLERNEIS